MSNTDMNAGSLSEFPSLTTHDMGGASRYRCTAVERDEAPPDDFGKRVDALRQLLAQKKLMTV
ncbi:nitrile hydratase, partial [Roseomonas sp. GCM10028921]